MGSVVPMRGRKKKRKRSNLPRGIVGIGEGLTLVVVMKKHSIVSWMGST